MVLVDYAVAERLADHLVNHPAVMALVVCGTTGESPTLTWDEEYQLFQVVKQAVAGRAKVARRHGLKLHPARLSPPLEKASSARGWTGHYRSFRTTTSPLRTGSTSISARSLALSLTCHLMLYNIPGRTGCNMAVDTIARLAEIPNIVAIKEASGSLDQASQIRLNTPDDFAIYSGDDSLTLPLLAVGGAGVVSVASHLVGNHLQQMIQAYETGNPRLATEIHLSLLPLFKVLFITANPIPVKLALTLKGWQVGSVRFPLCAPDDSVKASVEKVLQQLPPLPSQIK
jgi:4-hydroxy-tetrahydrodipicolinate synthase